MMTLLFLPMMHLQTSAGPTPVQMADAVRRILPYLEVSNRQRILEQLETPEPLVIVEGGKKRLRLGTAGASFDMRTGELLSFWCSLTSAEPRQATDAEIEARARQLLDALPPIQCQRFEADIYRKGWTQDDVMFQHFYGAKRCSNWAHVMIEAKTGRVDGFMLQPRLNHAKFGTAPCVSQEQALAAAQAAYQSIRPYPVGHITRVELMTGVPVAYQRPEADKFLATWDLPSEVRENWEHRIGIPFYEIVIQPLAVEPTPLGSSSMQVIIVDARNGRPLVVEPIFLRGGTKLGPVQAPGPKLAVTVAETKGTLRRVEASGPSGLRVSFIWEKEVRLGRFDADRELLWVLHDKQWLPYRATPPLIKALTQASRPSAFGKQSKIRA